MSSKDNPIEKQRADNDARINDPRLQTSANVLRMMAHGRGPADESIVEQAIRDTIDAREPRSE